MCTVDLTAWSSGGLFKIEPCRFNRVQKFIGKLAKNLSRHCQLSGKIEVVAIRQTRRFGLHPVDSWIIRLPTRMKEKAKIDERSEPSRVEIRLSRPLLASSACMLFPSPIDHFHCHAIKENREPSSGNS